MALSTTERLDLVAWSQTTAGFIFNSRIFLLLFGPFGILLAVNSTASIRETALVAIFGASSLLTAVILWVNWRYKVYALASFWFLVAIGQGILRYHQDPHTLLGRIFAYALTLVWALYGWSVWRRAGLYALANSDSFRDERSQFDKWKKLLDGQNEFPAGDFLIGYWTYRVLNAEAYWVVAQFKRGTKKLKSCHVYDVSDVAFTRLPSGKWQVDIAGSSGTKSFAEVEIPLSFPMPGRLS